MTVSGGDPGSFGQEEADARATIERLQAAHPASRGRAFNIVVTLIEVGGALVLFKLARHLGWSDVAAYLLGCLAPIVGAAAVWIRSRRLSGASAAIFAFTALSAVVAVIGSTTPKVLLYKDCATTAVVGLIFAGSCVIGRPLIFYFAQRYGTDGSAEGMRSFDLMWRAFPPFRRVMYRMSITWAVAYLVQAAVTAYLVAVSPFDTGYTWDQVLPIVATVIAIAVTVVISRRAQAEGRRRAEAEGQSPARGREHSDSAVHDEREP
ncbi:VC0807 family protein [Tsukamurella soli]|uniref:Intracellular septation protein A n=1 Tax=Tsukamurella soli TaxID=644556 RepID=A0ABP8J7P3_9ACTN